MGISLALLPQDCDALDGGRVVRIGLGQVARIVIGPAIVGKVGDALVPDDSLRNGGQQVAEFQGSALDDGQLQIAAGDDDVLQIGAAAQKEIGQFLLPLALGLDIGRPGFTGNLVGAAGSG